MIKSKTRIQEFEESLPPKYPEIDRVELYFDDTNNSIFLSDMYIRAEYRGKGVGTKIMNDIINLSDEMNLPVVLIPEPEENSMTQKQLINFYKKFGFVINRGKMIDYSLSIPFAMTMVRYPKKN
jgi:GNAT superfamily N-acetyltransferase